MPAKERYIIYIDTGGTFSDAIILRQDGSFVAGKAATTPNKLDDCFFNCIEAGAERMGKSLKEVLTNADEIGYGTTIGTNIMVTGQGKNVGFITTKGHEARTLITRYRAAGLFPKQAMHIISTDNPKPLVPMRLIRGVAERVDSVGEVVMPLQEDQVRQAFQELRQQKAESVAIGFLWSFLNPAHERRARDIIHEIAPGFPVSISSEVAPLVREYPRFISTIVDLYIGGALRELLRNIEGRLKEYGYTRQLLVMQAIGGVSRAEVVKPATTLHSGPVGGLAGVEFLKNVYGFKNAMGSDVGGTSFDVSVSSERGEEFLREPVAGRWEIANPMREIITIGAGGGTIAGIDKITGRLFVGPHSAGAEPGPVCYGAGGTEPTVSDADVVMNRIDPNYFLGGKRKLYRDKAVAAIKEKVADPMKMDVYQAAQAICSIIDSAMEATLRTTTAVRGIDPKDYVLFSFGGAGPSHCAGYTAGLGFPKVIIPPYAAVFCAFGSATTDIRHRYEASPFLLLPNLPFDPTTLKFDLDKLTSLGQIPDWVPQRFNTMFADLEARLLTDMEAEGFKKEQVSSRYELLARYGGQLWEIRCPSPVARLKTVDDLKAIIRAFEEEYSHIYSREAMLPAGGLEIISVALAGSAPTAKPQLTKRPFVGKDSSAALKNRRDVYFNDGFVKTNIYEMDRLQVGNLVEGPSIIEGTDTTVVIPHERKIAVDEYLNLVMEYR